MKKNVLTAVAALAAAIIPSTAQADKKVITETNIDLESAVYTTHKLYNANGNIAYKLTEGVEQTVYFYNALQQVEREEYTNLLNSNSSRTYVYTYNNNGQVATKEEKAGERSLKIETYTYDEHGNTATVTSGALPLPITYNNNYDESGRLSSYSITFMGREMGGASYTYNANGQVLTENIINGDTISYTYDDNGLLSQKDSKLNGTTVYTYGDIDPSLVPDGAAAEVGASNKVTFSWKGTATGIIFDGQYVETEGTSYTTEPLTDNTYTFYIINGGNYTTLENIDVFDNTKVGVTNIEQNGNVFVTAISEYDEAADATIQHLTYNIPVKWQLADGAQPTGFRIYYNEQYYVDVDDPTLREYVIPATNITIWNGAVVTLPFEINVVAVYATGEAQPNQTLKLDTDAIVALEPVVVDGIAPVRIVSDNTAVFTLNGVRLNNTSHLAKGAYIFVQGKNAKKVVIK